MMYGNIVTLFLFCLLACYFSTKTTTTTKKPRASFSSGCVDIFPRFSNTLMFSEIFNLIKKLTMRLWYFSMLLWFVSFYVRSVCWIPVCLVFSSFFFCCCFAHSPTSMLLLPVREHRDLMEFSVLKNDFNNMNFRQILWIYFGMHFYLYDEVSLDTPRKKHETKTKMCTMKMSVKFVRHRYRNWISRVCGIC